MASGLRQRRKNVDDGDDAPRSKPRITLESFDLYQKVRDKEDQVQTTSGATVSIIAVVVCAILVISELYGYFVPQQREHMVVDPIVEDRLRINFDISFHALTCAEANIDAMDVAGEQQNGLDHDIQKTRLAPDGTPIGDAFADRIKQEKEHHDEPKPLPPNYCGACYGAATREGQCCNTCDEVRAAYADKGWDVTAVTKDAEQCIREHRNPSTLAKAGEGCRVSGFLRVNKVAGNFHVAMGETHTRGAGHVHQFNPSQLGHYNVSHTIHTLSFGEPYPGMRNPLDGVRRMVAEGSGVWMYYLKVIPSVYLPHGGTYTPPKPQSALPAPGAAAAAGSGTSADATIWRSYDAISAAGTPAPGGAAHAVAAAADASRDPSGAVKTNQYSVTSQYRAAMLFGQRMNVLPGIFFVYEISPFMVTVTRHSTSLAQLLTSLFAILGGVLTLASVIDAGAFYASRLLKPQGRQALASAFAGFVSPTAAAASAALSSGGVGMGGGAPTTAAAMFSGTAGGSSGGAGSASAVGGLTPPTYVQGRPAALSAGNVSMMVTSAHGGSSGPSSSGPSSGGASGGWAPATAPASSGGGHFASGDQFTFGGGASDAATGMYHRAAAAPSADASAPAAAAAYTGGYSTGAAPFSYAQPPAPSAATGYPQYAGAGGIPGGAAATAFGASGGGSGGAAPLYVPSFGGVAAAALGPKPHADKAE